MKTSKLKKIILNKTHSHSYNITIRKMKLQFCFGVACTSFQSKVALTQGIVYVQTYIHAIDVNIIMWLKQSYKDDSNILLKIQERHLQPPLFAIMAYVKRISPLEWNQKTVAGCKSRKNNYMKKEFNRVNEIVEVLKLLHYFTVP